MFLAHLESQGADLSDVTQDDLDEISHLLNTRHGKALDFQTPREVDIKEFKQYHPHIHITGVALEHRIYRRNYKKICNF